MDRDLIHCLHNECIRRTVPYYSAVTEGARGQGPASALTRKVIHNLILIRSKMIQHKAIVIAQDISRTYADTEVMDPTVEIYREVDMRAGSGTAILRMTIPQTKALLNDLTAGLEELVKYEEDK